jgi:hypothetical protein
VRYLQHNDDTLRLDFIDNGFATGEELCKMKINPQEVSQPFSYFIFVFLVEGKPDFWIYVNEHFHRFLFLGEDCRWVRSQKRLPSSSIGCCVRISQEQKYALERECWMHHLSCVFFTDLMECLAFASSQAYASFTLGMAFPAGCLTEDGFVELQPAPNAKTTWSCDDPGHGPL